MRSYELQDVRMRPQSIPLVEGDVGISRGDPTDALRSVFETNDYKYFEGVCRARLGTNAEIPILSQHKAAKPFADAFSSADS
jgi:hypothetical protein